LRILYLDVYFVGRETFEIEFVEKITTHFQ
jgi:hypothetical protein